MIRLVIFLIILFLLFLYINKKKIEKFTVIPDDSLKLNIMNPDNIDIPFNQNYDKVWKSENVSHKSNYYQDIPILSSKHFEDLDLSEFETRYKGNHKNLKKILKMVNNKSNQEFLEVDYDKIKILDYNSNTWTQQMDYNNVKYIDSDIESINKLNKLFIKNLNKLQKEILSNDELVNYGIEEFQILNYKIKNIYLDKTYLNKDLKEDNFKYGMIVTLFRKNNFYNPVVYYEGYLPNYFDNVELIGYYNTSHNFMYNGIDKNNLDYNLNTNILTNKKDNILIGDVFKNNELRQKYIDGFKIKNQYVCFDNNNNMIPFLNQNDCESDKTWYGTPKKKGLYDKPCQKDEDCPFYNMNRNYTNKRGGCNNGFCELPYGMKPRGFKYYQKEEPYCYNCDTDVWNPVTNIKKCCDKQFDKSKYPFLDGPDYMFSNDYKIRFQFFHKNNCKKVGDSIRCNL